MLTQDRTEELLLLLNDIHVRLEMLKEVLGDYKEIDCDWILDEIKPSRAGDSGEIGRAGSEPLIKLASS
jgi:hypothetical protein